MAITKTDNQHYQNIANAIRTKTGTEETFQPSEMAAAISAIPSGLGTFIALEPIEENYTPSASGTETHSMNLTYWGTPPKYWLVVYEFYTVVSYGPTCSNGAFVMFDANGNIVASYSKYNPLTVTKSGSVFTVSVEETVIRDRQFHHRFSGGSFA